MSAEKSSNAIAGSIIGGCTIMGVTLLMIFKVPVVDIMAIWGSIVTPVLAAFGYTKLQKIEQQTNGITTQQYMAVQKANAEKDALMQTLVDHLKTHTVPVQGTVDSGTV